MQISKRANAIPHVGSQGQKCHVPGCGRQTQRSASNGLSELYCKVHVEHHRRHGSYWRRSYTASEIAPYRTAVRLWLRKHKGDQSMHLATAAIDALMRGAGAAESAHDLRRLSGEEKARVALARLREAGVPSTRILEVAIAVAVLVSDRGPQDSEFRDVQIAKAVHRMASGTHRSTSGFVIPSKYAPSTGHVLRVLGRNVLEGFGFLLNGTMASEVVALAQPVLVDSDKADQACRRAEDAVAREMLRVADFGMGPQRLKQYRDQLRRQLGLERMG